MKKLMFRILPIIVLIIVALLGVSYAMFSSSFELGQSGLTTGTIDVNFTENKNTLKLERAVPEYDSEGKVSDNYLDFTVDAKVTGDFVVPYVVTAEKDSTLSNIDDKYIKLYLERSTDGINYQTVMEPKTFEEVSESTTGVKLGSMIIDTGNLTKTTKYYYRLRMWLDGSYNNSSSSNTFVLTTNAYLTTEQENVDTTKPVCTFSNPSISVANTSEIELTCTDNTIGINETVLNLNDIEINNDNLELLSISNPEKIANGYKYKISVKGLSIGTTNISLASGKISDKLGNQIDNVSKELTIKGFTYNVTYIKDSNIKSLEKDSDSCTTTGSNTSCSITLPTVEVEEGYRFLGYYDNDTKINTNTIEISEDKTINIKSESDSYTVEYDYIENGGDSVSENTEEDVTTSASTTKVAAESIDTSKIATKSAYNLKTANNKKSMFKSVVYNKNIDLTPKAERIGYEFVGWNTDKDAKTGLKTLKMSRGNIVLYAIYKKIVTTSFEVQDPEAVTIKSKNVVCTMYNKDSDCSIKSPKLTAKTGYTALGWNTSSKAKTSKLKGNITTKVTDNSKYYSITRNNTKYTATFNVQDSNAATKSGGNLSCYRYNGAKNCRVTAPTLTANSGYTIEGWNTDKASEKGLTTFFGGNTYYSITYKEFSSKFIVQDEKVATANATTANCKAYNGAESCAVDPPTLTIDEGYSALGWNTNKYSREGTLDNKIVLTDNESIYYSITRNDTKLTASYHSLGGVKSITINDENKYCYRYNGEDGCIINGPIVVTKSDEDEYIGISRSPKDYVIDSSYDIITDTLALTEENTGLDWCLQVRSKKPLEATFVAGNGVQIVDKTSDSCYKRNGVDGCTVKFPTTKTNPGYGTVQWYEGDKRVLSAILKGNTTYTARASLINYSIDYYLNKGKCDECEYSYTTEDTLTLGIPKRDGYEFLGWIGSNGTTPERNVTIQKGNTGNKEYTANWRAKFQIISGDINTIGSVAALGDEKLYVIGKGTGEESGYIKLLTMYNLKENSQVASKADEVKFSSRVYWYNQVGSGLKYPGNFEGNPYPYIYDNETNLYKAVNEYAKKFVDSGISDVTGRLLSYEEFNSLPLSIQKCEEDYWLGSLQTYYYVWFVTKDGTAKGGISNGTSHIRPVILVPTSSIN